MPTGTTADSVKVISEITKDVGILTTQIENGDFNEILHTLIGWGLELGKKIILALVIYFVGRWLVKRLNSIATKIMQRREMEASLQTFLQSVISIGLNLILIVAIIGVLGIETSSFVALFASAGIAIGMAMSGTLQNFAGGVMILFFKPFKVGDVIETQGYVGTVKEIQITTTHVNTFDNQVVIVPNGGLSNSTLKNITKEETRRVDLVINIAYGDDYDLAKQTLMEIINQDQRILTTPEPFVALQALNSSSVDIVVRVWAAAGDVWPVHFDLNEKIYKTFPTVGLHFPFPQTDVHLYNH